MPESSENKKKVSTLEAELYLLIAKFLRTGPCKRTAEVLREELEEHKLLPKRIDWLGNEHNRSFNELDTLLSQITDDHLLKICSRVGPILDKELPPTVSGLTSLLGVGRQSLLRTREELEKTKCQLTNLSARQHGMPLYPSPTAQSNYPPNIAQVISTRELSGPITSRHAFSPKIYARQQPFRRLLGHLSSVYCVLFDRTGKYIFTGADDLLVKIWSATDGRLLATLRGHSAEITDMAVNYENTLLAAGSCDKTIRVWCLHTTAPIAVLNGHTGMVTSLQFCPYPKNSDQLLISTGNDGCVCFWQWNPQTNVFNPKPLKFTERNKAGAQMICSSFSPGGLFLATGSTDHNVRVYNINGLNGPEKILEREMHSDRVDSLQFSNKDCRFISGSKDGTALIWKYERQNWSSIQLKMTAKLPGEVSNEAEDSKLKLRVTMVGWTLDDSRVVTAVSDSTIKVWNSYNGTLCHILKGHEDEVFVLEAHPTDSRIFLSSGHDGRIILWDLTSGSIIKNHFNLIEGQGHGAVFDCKFSPDGLMFASTDSHGHLCIFGFGSNERYKKVPEEQFFHTDYRPLIRDIHHHVLDEQTQTAPHLLPPPFLVDIDGNPYPPHFQRLVPGREHCNESQLIPYVAVSAEGESEILEPVRSTNDAPDRPTIDDMIERLQQEQHFNDTGPQQGSSDSLRSPQSRRRAQSTSDDRSAQEPFSPRTPRSQAGHSRVGLRRTGESEGVQSVGNWQSRGNQDERPAWVKRVVVKPISASLSLCYYKKRVSVASFEASFFHRELKKRPTCDLSTSKLYNKEREMKRGSREGLRTSARGKTQEQNGSAEVETPEGDNFNTSTDTESEQNTQDTTEEESEDSSASVEYSDWGEDVGIREQRPKPPPPKPQSRSQRLKARRVNQSSDDESATENSEEGEDDDEEDEEMSPDEPQTSKPSRKRKPPPPKRKMVNGKKLLERFRPPEWLTDVTPQKAPYVPQIGDEVVYFRQGHELYVQAVKRNRIYDIYMRSQPWRKLNLRDQEIARIEDITFENHPPRLCCLKLQLMRPATKQQSDTFTVKYHDMADVIDFIVLKQNFDQAILYDWKPGDRFRSAIDKAWWLGTIKSQKPLNPLFPDSMFQCFLVKWDNGEIEHMSPWDFERIDSERMPEEEGGSVDITPEERQAMMYVPSHEEWSEFGRDHDCDRIARGLTRVMELSIAESFICPVDLNQYPSYAMVVEYPMDLGTIKARLQHRFYRRLEAVKFDVRYIALNAQKFNECGSKIVKQAKCVVDLCVKFIESTFCVDPMIIYHEMMEAKQSRSQDSQSELDVLCSESDSDGDQRAPMRLKRKKNNMTSSSKRVRIGTQKYTSLSWRQQCLTFVDKIFQWDDSTPFRYPVNLTEYPDYRDIIDCPMDLSTVREKLNNNIYYSPTDFCKDMRLVFQNSRNYNTNKKSRIYSMTIRLSAMFEEQIRQIVSDWRSAVKYEEKIKNNQYVSNRRKPIPVQEDVNVGASTSRGFSTSLQSSLRGESSRHGVNKILNTAFCSNSKRPLNSSRLANGSGPKKHKLLKSSAHLKRKHIDSTLGYSLTNGTARKTMIRVKRKLPERSLKKQVVNTKMEPTNTKGSRSDSNPSSQSLSSSPESSSVDSEFGRKRKRRRKDSKPRFSKILRPRRSRHSKLTRQSYGLRAHSSSPEIAVDALNNTPKASLSPLHTRSQRTTRLKAPILHCLRERPIPKKIPVSSEASESDDSTSQNQNSAETSKTSSSSNTSTRNIRNSRKYCRGKYQESPIESEDSSDHEPQPTQRPSRAATRRALKTSPISKRRNSIQTRNRGQRTVRYGEDSDEEESPRAYDSETAETTISRSCRGRLRPAGTNRRSMYQTNRICGTGMSFRRKGFKAKINLPSISENSTSTSEKNVVLTGRKRGRKRKENKPCGSQNHSNDSNSSNEIELRRGNMKRKIIKIIRRGRKRNVNKSSENQSKVSDSNSSNEKDLSRGNKKRKIIKIIKRKRKDKSCENLNETIHFNSSSEVDSTKDGRKKNVFKIVKRGRRKGNKLCDSKNKTTDSNSSSDIDLERRGRKKNIIKILKRKRKSDDNNSSEIQNEAIASSSGINLATKCRKKNIIKIIKSGSKGKDNNSSENHDEAIDSNSSSDTSSSKRGRKKNIIKIIKRGRKSKVNKSSENQNQTIDSNSSSDMNLAKRGKKKNIKIMKRERKSENNSSENQNETINSNLSSEVDMIEGRKKNICKRGRENKNNKSSENQKETIDSTSSSEVDMVKGGRKKNIFKVIKSKDSKSSENQNETIDSNSSNGLETIGSRKRNILKIITRNRKVEDTKSSESQNERVDSNSSNEVDLTKRDRKKNIFKIIKRGRKSKDNKSAENQNETIDPNSSNELDLTGGIKTNVIKMIKRSRKQEGNTSCHVRNETTDSTSSNEVNSTGGRKRNDNKSAESQKETAESNLSNEADLTGGGRRKIINCENEKVNIQSSFPVVEKPVLSGNFKIKKRKVRKLDTETENSPSTSSVEEKPILSRRKHIRKSKFTTKNLKNGTERIQNGTTEISNCLLPNFMFNVDNNQTFKAKLIERKIFLKNFRQTRAKYRQVGLKTLGLNYRRKAMLCKIALPILCVKNKFPYFQGPKKHPGRKRLKRRRFGQNKARISKMELFRINSNSSNGLLTESSFDSPNCNQNFASHSKSGWRNKKIRPTASSMNELFMDATSNINHFLGDSVIEAINTSSSKGFKTQSHTNGSHRSQNNTDILRRGLLKVSPSDFPQKGNDVENTNSSQGSSSHSKYNLKEINPQSSFVESLQAEKYMCVSDDPVQTRFKGQRITTYNEESDSEWVAEWDSDDSDTLTYCSGTSDETIVNDSEETEISSDTESLPGLDFRDFLQHDNLQLSNGRNSNIVQDRCLRSTGSVIENIDYHCNNAMMCSTNS